MTSSPAARIASLNTSPPTARPSLENMFSTDGRRLPGYATRGEPFADEALVLGGEFGEEIGDFDTVVKHLDPLHRAGHPRGVGNSAVPCRGSALAKENREGLAVPWA